MQPPVELAVLTALMVFAASMWIPYIIGITTDPNAGEAFVTPADRARLRPWVQRAYRAQQDLIEQGLPFAVLVLIADRLGAFSTLTAGTALAFLVIRVLHAAGMISGVAGNPLRPILFNLGWLCCLIMAYAIFAHMI